MEYWKTRAKRYEQLEWVKNQTYLEEFIATGEFEGSNIVLDVGTGTGVIAHTVAPLVKQVTGLDNSSDMLGLAHDGNIRFIEGDIRDLPFEEGTFDRVTARLVFHHILTGTQLAMNECYRVLKDGGLMIFAEGIPPSLEVKDDYIKIFKFKEERLTFMAGDLVQLLARANFQDIRCKIIILKMSVRNWMENSGLPRPVQEEIYNLHRNAEGYFKKAYQMVETEDDCIINTKVAILRGMKCKSN